jgi:RimJ/RimL family protein N-acetyltransferase
MIRLETPRLILRNWHDGDQDVFHELMSDDKVMEFFHYRRTREESDKRLAELTESIEDIGFGFYAIELKETGECLGMCGIAQLEMEPQFPQGTFETGWRFAARHWGKGYATESAKAAISDGFLNHGLSDFVAIAVKTNHRSIAVMERIGMARDPDGDFDHPGVPEDQPALIRHVTCRISRNQWARTLPQ